MKNFFSCLALFLLAANSLLAQGSENSGSVCDASKSCAKACQMKDFDEKVDADPAYQKLLFKCAEDVAKKLQMIK